ncbi:MAG: phosphotransferase [Clostridia bacterium]|nr:phosphotransferase [Clostridia bacterium]
MSKATVFIPLAGRIDSSNVPEMERQILTLMQEQPDSVPVFDASGLVYISSAGLRVLMKIRKAFGHEMEIRNVSPEVYEILETTGFTELFPVKKRMREVSVEGCEVIGRGYYGTVYRLDPDTIVKVYASSDSLPLIENERKMAKMAFVHGIPTAISYDIVKVGDSYGSVFELLKARTMNDLLVAEPRRADELVRSFVDVMKTVHAVELAPGTLPSARDIWMGHLDTILQWGSVSEKQHARIRKMLCDLPDSNGVVHGDFHMKNVMVADGEPLLIDMDTLAQGSPIFDLQGVYVAYQAFEEDEPGNTLAFLGISAEMSGFVWRKTMEYYFDAKDAETQARNENRIRLLAAVRFLQLIGKTDLKANELAAIRVRHTRAHIDELLEKVDSLILE